MYLYKVYDFDYDDTKYFVLLHSNKFTKQEYENIVNDCRKKVFRQLRINKKFINSEKDFSENRIEELLKLSGDYDVWKNLRKTMIEDYSFKDLDVEYVFALHSGSYVSGKRLVNKVIE